MHMLICRSKEGVREVLLLLLPLPWRARDRSTLSLSGVLCCLCTGWREARYVGGLNGSRSLKIVRSVFSPPKENAVLFYAVRMLYLSRPPLSIDLFSETRLVHIP